MTNDLSLRLYRNLYTIRRAEEYIIKHYAEDEMKTPMHMTMGQEAVSSGVCAALGEEGQIFASYRSHGPFLAKTEDTDAFFAELYGKVTGPGRGKSGSMHLAQPERGHMCSSAIVASCIPVAVGAAFANKRRVRRAIVCVFFGDGALDEGVFWESLNAACVMKIPVLFVCEDNRLAVHTPTEVRQGYRRIEDIVSQLDCHVIVKDTTDVEIIYQLACEAVAAIRSTGKPAFLYLRCYRYLEHVGVYDDFQAGYRSRADFEKWLERDSLALQRQRLLDQGCSEEDVRALELAVDRKIEASITRAREAAFPSVSELYKGVFHEAD